MIYRTCRKNEEYCDVFIYAIIKNMSFCAKLHLNNPVLKVINIKKTDEIAKNTKISHI